MTKPRPRRRRRWLAAIAFVLIALASAGFAVLRVELEGPALADKISTTLNKRMRGRIAIGSIDWDVASLPTAVTGGWVPLTFRDVRVWDDCALDTSAHALDEIRQGDPNEDCTADERPDPDPTSKRKPRKLLLRTDKITAEVDIHALMFGNHDFVFRNLWVHGGEALLEQTSEPYPLHAYDRTIVSIITAFYPRMKGGFRAGIYADTPSPIFDLRDIHIKDLNLTVHMSPYALSRLVVHGSGRRPLTGNVAFVSASNYDLPQKPFVFGGDACRPPAGDLVRGKIVLVDGGGCSAKEKAWNVQTAGAIGMVLADDQQRDVPPTLDDDPAVTEAITIAVVGIGKRDGDAIKRESAMTAGTGTATLRDKVGFSTTARILGVDVDAGDAPENDSYLYMDSIDPLVTKFYVRLEATAKSGTIRVNDEALRPAFRLPAPGEKLADYGKGREAEYAIDIHDIKLHRLAQLPTEWTRRDYVANTLELDVEARTIPCEDEDFPIRDPKLGAYVHITGELLNYWDRPYDGSWNLKIDTRNAGQTVRTCIDSDFGGDQLEGTMTITGPFVALPKFGLAMRNLDYDLWLRGDREPLRLTLAEVQGWIDLVNDQGAIEKTTALINSGKEPGEVAVAATFGLKPYNARAHVEIVHAIDVERFLPSSAEPVGKFLQGRLTAVGDDAVGFSLENFDLALGRTPKEKSFRMHQGRLFTNDKFDTINVQRVQLEAGKSRAEMNGIVDVKNDNLDIEISKGSFPDLDLWLSRFGMPGFVKSAGGGVIRIKGPLSNPRVNVVATELNGVPCLDRVTIHDSEYNSDTGVLDVKELSSAGFGGTLKGNARLVTGDKSTGKATMIEKLHVEGRRLDASRICKVGNHVKGTIDTVDVDLSGTVDPNRTPMDWLSLAKIHARANRLSLYGDRFKNLAMCLNRRDDAACRPRTAYLDGDDLQQCEAGKRDKNGFCAVVTATRDGGGYVDATIARLPAPRPVPSPRAPAVKAPKGPATQIGGSIGLSDVPIAIIDQLLDLKQAGQLGGSTSLTLHLQGDPTAPQGTGSIDLLRSWLKSSFLGDAKLALSPGRIDNMPGLSVRGTALAGRLEITGTIGTRAPYPVELVIRGSRIEVDTIIDLQKRLGLPLPVQAWASGKITLRHQLAPAKPVEPIVWVELTELVGIVTHKSEDGRIIPLRVAAVEQDPGKRPAVSLRVTPSSIEFKCRDPKAGTDADCTTKLELGAQSASAPAGVIDFRGHVTPQHVAIEAVGKLDLSPIAPLVDTMFKQVSGTADVQASISGTTAKPSYEASLQLRNVTAQRAGTDTVLQAPTGLIKLARGSLGFTGVTLRVHDKHGEDGEVHVKGTIELDGLTPKDWHLLVDGKVAGQMLLVLMPELVSQASGLARIEGDLQLTGKGPRPEVLGTLSFEPECADGKPTVDGECTSSKARSRPLTVTIRGAHRELACKRGSLEIETVAGTSDDDRTYVFRLSDFETSIDGQGAVTIDYGYAEIRGGELAQLAVRLDAEAIPFRTTDGKLDLVISGTDVSITKTSLGGDLSLAGVVTIIDGTYRQDFEITEGIRSLGSNAPPSTPVWDVYPTLGDAKLDLTVVLGKFVVQSNIASIELGGSVDLRATPKDPKLSGQIDITHGRFRLPGMRAAFTRTSGTIRFDSRERAGNPDLQIQSDADYRDLSGQDHVITMTIFGHIDNLGWDLKTSTGYNKSQTVSLLLLGRNPEQLRRSLGDQTLGSDPGTIDPSTNPTQGFGDQIVKDLAGEWVSDLLENSLTRLTRLDVLRIEVGFGSIGLHAEKRMIENVTLLGTTEQTIRGNTINVRGELKTPYVITNNGGSVSAQTGVLIKNFNDPAEEDITDLSLKLVFRLFIP